ncbi:MAG: energy transducer TonB [Deltaproteobacteria bacterium]|nr:energy transducer TonB [Deltaproteobacteria bacterium]
MMNRKVFTIAILISLAGHVAVLAVSSLPTIMMGAVSSDGAFTIHFEDTAGSEHETLLKATQEPVEKPVPAQEGTVSPGISEDVIDINSTDPRFSSYLARIRYRIECTWNYPYLACALKQEGSNVVRFSITSRGILVDPIVVESSGYDFLDRESLRTVMTAAPFPPFPEDITTPRLNILARFTYELSE